MIHLIVPIQKNSHSPQKEEEFPTIDDLQENYQVVKWKYSTDSSSHPDWVVYKNQVYKFVRKNGGPCGQVILHDPSGKSISPMHSKCSYYSNVKKATSTRRENLIQEQELQEEEKENQEEDQKQEGQKQEDTKEQVQEQEVQKGQNQEHIYQEQDEKIEEAIALLQAFKVQRNQVILKFLIENLQRLMN